MSIVTELARWAHDLHLDDVPERIVERVRLQHLHAAANVRDVAHRSQAKVFEASLAGVPRNRKAAAATVAGRSVDQRGAARLHAALGGWVYRQGWMLGGEPSAAATSVAWAFSRGRSVDDVLVATVAANEVAGRLGLSRFLSPEPEDAFGHVPTAAAVIVAGRLAGLDADTMAHALALALCTSVDAPHRARFGPGGRLALGAAPVAAALDAIDLACAGVRGPLDLLDAGAAPSEPGVGPIRAAFGGRGQAWLSTTLAFPQTAAPRADQAAVQSVGEILTRHVKAADKRLRCNQVDRIELSLTADGLRTARHLGSPSWAIEALHADLPRLLGLLVANHDIGPAGVDEDTVQARLDDIGHVAGRVHLQHSLRRTAQSALHRLEVLAPVLAGVSRDELAVAFGPRVGRGPVGVPTLDELQLLARLRPAALADRFRYESGDLADVRLEELQLQEGADVRLYTSRGGCWRASSDLPAGSPGAPWAGTVDWVLGAWGDAETARGLLEQAGGDDAAGWSRALLNGAD